MAEHTEAETSLTVLLEVMARLRDPDTGCDWDKQQNFASIVPYTIEEAYEVADAIHQGNMTEIKDELGDLLFQVVFYARLGQEQGEFDFAAICQQQSEKLIRRHPHVFERSQSLSEQQLSDQWQAIKARERQDKGQGEDNSVLANIPQGLAPLKRALKLQNRCAMVGFDWTEVADAVDKIHEEIDEVMAEVNANCVAPMAVEEEIGDLLFAVVNLARHLKVDAESALLKANSKFEKRFRGVEREVARQGRQISDCQLPELEAIWQDVKKNT